MFPQIFGKYVLEGELAAGGMARVYLATLRGAVGFEKRLVVKQIRPELASDQAFVQRFVEEAKTAVELSHPNIAPVYELGVEQGVYYIAMEFCPGATLSEVLAESGQLSPEEGAYVGVEICRALDYAHRRAGIVHRDATPRNVLIDEEGAVRLIDFGIAAPVTDDPRRQEVFGSPGHMPPEQIAGKPLTPATDVFAVAALLVEAWSGRPPFRRATARESEQALYLPPSPLAEHDVRLAPLQDLIGGALALDPQQRPARAELFARPLRDFLRSVDSGDIARRLGDRVRRCARRAERDGVWGVGPSSSTPPAIDRSQPRTPASLTRTFAARNEVREWSRRLDSPESEVPASSPVTRKLPSVRTRQSSAEAVGEPPGAGAASHGSRTRRVLLVAGTLAAVAGASGWLWLRSQKTPQTPLTRPPVAAVRPSAHPAPVPGPAPKPVVTAASSSAPQSSSARDKAQNPTAASASGTLRLTADPPANVSVQGTGVARSLVTPVRELKLPAGAYTVTFQSPTFDAPVVTRVVVHDGVSRSVHADFREADPRVTVR